MHPIRTLKALKPPPPNGHWQPVRDQRVREAELNAEIELKRLEAGAALMVERKRRVDAELERMGEAEAGVKAHRSLAHLWGAGFVFAAIVSIMTTLWTLNWYLTLTWERAVLAVALLILPLIGWAAFLLMGKVEVSGRVLCGLGLAVVIFAGVASAFLAAGRMAGVLMEEERQQSAAVSTSGELGAARDPESSAQVSRVKKLLAVSTMVSVILLAVSGEIAAGLAFHQYYRHMTVVRTVWPYYREHAALSQALAENLAAQENVRRQPGILAAQLTAQGLEHEAARMERAEAEARAAIRVAADADRRANSLGPVVKAVLVAAMGAVLLLVGLATYVFAAERHASIVVLDVSGSMAPGEFAKNVQAVEGVVERLGPDSRLVILGVGEESFSRAPLFLQTSPANAGRFGEYLATWRSKTIREWRRVAAELRPSAKGSDIVGALARAATEFDETPGASKTLIVLSDMRHVGRGLSLEARRGRPEIRVLADQRLVPRLDGAQVWMLGVHTAGIDVARWQELKRFWTRYFQAAGAEVKAFSPNRRMSR